MIKVVVKQKMVCPMYSLVSDPENTIMEIDGVGVWIRRIVVNEHQ